MYTGGGVRNVPLFFKSTLEFVQFIDKTHVFDKVGFSGLLLVICRSSFQKEVVLVDAKVAPVSKNTGIWPPSPPC